jgi:hypothetical protein
MRLLRYCIHKPSTNALRASIVGLQPSPTLTTNPGIASGSAVIRSALEEVLRKAKKMGEAKPSLDERAVAYFLQSTIGGHEGHGEGRGQFGSFARYRFNCIGGFSGLSSGNFLRNSGQCCPLQFTQLLWSLNVDSEYLARPRQGTGDEPNASGRKALPEGYGRVLRTNGFPEAEGGAPPQCERVMAGKPIMHANRRRQFRSGTR